VAKKTRSYFFIVLSLLITIACNLPFSADSSVNTRTPQTPVNATEVAQTVIAGLTIPASTLSPTAGATRTQEPPVAAPTNSPTITLTPIPCNHAAFLADVTIPDGTEIQTNTGFTKTWRLQNTGSCTWTSGYHVVFDSGDRMNAPDSVAVTSGTVPSGSSVEVSVPLKAPASAGTYRGYFRLRSPDGVVFGVGGGAAFYTEIVAVAPGEDEAPDLAPPVAGQPDLKITDITFSPYPLLKKGRLLL